MKAQKGSCGACLCTQASSSRRLKCTSQQGPLSLIGLGSSAQPSTKYILTSQRKALTCALADGRRLHRTTSCMNVSSSRYLGRPRSHRHRTINAAFPRPSRLMIWSCCVMETFILQVCHVHLQVCMYPDPSALYPREFAHRQSAPTHTPTLPYNAHTQTPSRSNPFSARPGN